MNIIEKKGKKSENLYFSQISQLDYLTNEMLKEKISIEHNFTVKYRNNASDVFLKIHILNISLKNFTGSKSGKIVANVKFFIFRTFLRKLVSFSNIFF